MRVRHFALNSISNSGGSSRYAFELSSEENKYGIDSKVIGFQNSSGRASRLRKIWKLRNTGVDVVNIHYAGSFGILGFALIPIKMSGIRIVHTFHGPWHLEAKSAGKSKLRVLVAFLTQKSIFMMSDSIIAMSESFASIARQFTNKKILVQPPGINYENNHTTHSNAKLKSDCISMCIVRRLVPRMGIDLAIQALQYLPNRYILRIVGTGPEETKLKEIVENLDLGLRVEFLGQISDIELNKILLESDLMVVPTRELEGYGIVVIEAFARCLPVIATPVQGLLESIPQEFHEWAISKEISASSIAEKISDLTPELIPSHIEFQSLLQRNGWSKILPKIINEYRKL